MTKLAFDLRDFKISVDRLAPQQIFRTRQGQQLSYRFYPAWSEDLVVLCHGVGGDSRYLCNLADAIAKQGLAQVVTPDFRGHGASIGVSDVISKSQLEIDLEELLIHIKMRASVRRVILAGHSLGAGFALRIAVSEISNQFAKFIALAPYLPESFHASKPDFGGWILPDAGGGFAVNYPEAFRTGEEKIHYSPEFLAAAVAPDDLLSRLSLLKLPVAVLTGDRDEVVIARRHQEIFQGVVSEMKIAEGLNHITIVSKADAALSLF